MTFVAILSASGLLLAGCAGSPTSPAACDSECQQAKAMEQLVREQSAWEAEYREEQNHITATLDPETEAQLRVDAPKVIAYDKCEGKTFGSGGYDVAALKVCYAQLLASGFGPLR